MNIEKDTVELCDFDEIVKYLKLGWMLTGDYIVNVSKDGRPDPAPRHILAWGKEGAPQYPENIRMNITSGDFNSSLLFTFRNDDLAPSEKPRVERERART